VNALELFRPLMRDHIAPRLRELGFVGSGQNYRLPNPAGHFAHLNFQRDKWNDATACGFTGNITFIRREDWPEGTWMGERPTGGAWYPVPGVYERIGAFMGTDDHWWVIRTEADLRPIAEEVVDVVRDAVLPDLRFLVETPPDP
jgi:hypothetical protein